MRINREAGRRGDFEQRFFSFEPQTCELDAMTGTNELAVSPIQTNLFS
jgi:hypothetical protein